MAELNNTAWLEEYMSMWTTKERMGKIHKVTSFDPTCHCYPEGVYLLDDDCRAHTAIYVVDKEHNVHIIYDGMAWDLLARAVDGLTGTLLRIAKTLEKIEERLGKEIAPAPAPNPEPEPEPKEVVFTVSPETLEIAPGGSYSCEVTSTIDGTPAPWIIEDAPEDYPKGVSVAKADDTHVTINVSEE